MIDESPEPVDDGPEDPTAAGAELTGQADAESAEPAESADAGAEVTSLKSSFTPGQPASTTSKILVVLFATVLIIGGIYVASPDDISDTLSMEREGFDQDVNRNMDLGYKSPFLAAGINQPEIRGTSEVRFAAACRVVGISAGESHRAYPMVTLLGSFTRDGKTGSIVNDTLGGMLITVTNDGDAGLIRVFRLSETSSRKTIGLGLMGMQDGGGMGLTFDREKDYRQDLEEIPDLADHPFATATLAEWMVLHPETDVYVGEFLTPDLQMESTLEFMSAPERIEADKVLKERNRQSKILSPKRKTRSAGSSKTTRKERPSTSPPDAGSGTQKSSQKGSGKSSSPQTR